MRRYCNYFFFKLRISKLLKINDLRISKLLKYLMKEE